MTRSEHSHMTGVPLAGLREHRHRSPIARCGRHRRRRIDGCGCDAVRRAVVALLTFTAIVATLSTAGCQQRRVRVEMAAGDGSVERAFTSNTLDDDSVRRISEAYGGGPTRDRPMRGLRFEGQFGTVLPNELGNRSGLDEVQTTLGSAWFYFEAFGEGGGRHGDDWVAMRQRMDAGDLWVRLFGLWAERQMPAGPKRDRFRDAVETELVPMARNIMLRYGAMQSVAQSQRIGGRLREADEVGARSDDESFWQQVFVPLSIAFAEEGIFTPSELQRLLLLSLDGRAGGDSRQWSLDEIFIPALTRQVRRFRPDAESVSMGQLFTMGISFWLFASSSSERIPLLLASPAIPEEDKARLRRGDRSVRLPPPFGIEPRRRVPTTDTEVRLRMTRRPYLTNGVWEEDEAGGSGVVVFRTSFTDADNRSVLYEPVFYAAWAEPASQRQQSLFGTVLLAGETLAEYCLWHEMLPTADRRAWGEGLARLAERGDVSLMSEVARRASTRRLLPEPLREWIDERESAAR